MSKMLFQQLINMLYTEECTKRKEVDFGESLVASMHSLTKDDICLAL
jgi:hypothetical protein